jgi:hypothetical protein
VKFKVTKTSVWDHTKPCEEAKKERCSRIEIRTLASFEEFDKKYGECEGAWTSKGINHCINEDGYVQREFPNDVTRWFVEINTLDELLDFVDKHGGDVIISKILGETNIYYLEIYDGYRE